MTHTGSLKTAELKPITFLLCVIKQQISHYFNFAQHSAPLCYNLPPPPPKNMGYIFCSLNKNSTASGLSGLAAVVLPLTIQKFHKQ